MIIPVGMFSSPAGGGGGGGGAGIALVNQTVARTASGGTPKTITIPAPTNGNALRLLFHSINNATITSVSSTGATWTKFAGISNTTPARIELWGADNVTSAGTTVNLVISNVYAVCDVNITEWSGMPATGVPDGGSTNSGTGASVSTPSVTPAAGNPVLLMAATTVYTNTITAGPTGGFSALTKPSGAHAGLAWAYQLVTSASGSYSCGWTANAGYARYATIVQAWDGT